MAHEREAAPEERKAAGQPPGEPLPTEQPDAAEPAGAGDAGAEEQIDSATERPPGLEAEPAEAAEAAEAAEEEDPLARAERERDGYLELAQRTQADFENFRKRQARDLAAAGERAKAGLVRELLSVVDNLERALAAPGDDIREGVQLVHAELLGVLERSGIESFDPSGEQFDPTVHEALSTRQQEGAEPGVVLDVVEKGYKLNGAVLRPARVVVSG